MIELAISKSIKLANWLSIEYLNQDGETTNYWIAIKDIDIENKTFIVDAFNLAKINNDSNGLIQIKIYFNNIKEAMLIENTTYDQPIKLIEKINNNINNLDWLKYDTYNDQILDYIFDCLKYENIAYQSELTLVRGIDNNKLSKFSNVNKYELSYEQISDLVPRLEGLSKRRESHNYETTELAFNLLSINTKKGLFVVAYKKVLFNPREMSLVLEPEIYFNYDFQSDDQYSPHNLRHYLDIETDAFTSLFIDEPRKAKELLHSEVIKYKETLDDRPYIFELKRSVITHIEKEFNAIKLAKANNTLTTPLDAFFGNMTKSKLSKKRSFDVVLIDDRANIDQLRVIYNSLFQPITYVQGPPGTGKTATIINILISAFFNGQKVLVSSNNNKPINDIYEKLINIKNTFNGREIPIPLPILRLGNKDEVIKTLNNLKSFIEKYSKYISDDEKLDIHANNKKEKMQQINTLIATYEKRLELTEEIDTLKSLVDNFSDLPMQSINLETLLNQKISDFNKLPYISDDDIKSIFTKADKHFYTWLFFTSVKYIKRIYEPKNSWLLDIINSNLEDDEKFSTFNSAITNSENFKNLIRIFPIILTTNQSSHRLGPQQPNFDLAIIDEAGQCSIGPSLFAISRAERILLVGDQNQLRPVVTIAPETNNVLLKKYSISSAYNYTNNSILLTMQQLDTISKFILLRYHYRSRKDIIEFSNKKYYRNMLKIETKEVSNIPDALEYIDVDSELNPIIKNTSLTEIEQIISHIKSSKQKNIGIITPYRNQANLIKERLTEEKIEGVECGTIHTFQGDEKDIIYLSSGITKNTHERTFNWLKNNQELINVATTRAKKKLVLVSDFKEIKKRSTSTNDFYELSEYVKNKGKETKLTESDTYQFVNGANFKNYNTKKEKEFLETIKHILTIGNKFIVKPKVRVASILDKFTSPKKFDYGLKAEFDLVIFKLIQNEEIPVLVVELDGPEHINDNKVIERDRIKKSICDDNKIKLIRIGNDYSRRYEYIKEVLNQILVV